jgi:hypothetical protein
MKQNRNVIRQDGEYRVKKRNICACGILSFLLLISTLALLSAGCQAIDFPFESVVSMVSQGSSANADTTAETAVSKVSSAKAGTTVETAVSQDPSAIEGTTAETAAAPDFALSDLKNTDAFTEGALEHIFEGVNPLGVASGYHYEGVPSAGGSVVPGTATTPDANGVYEARITVGGVKKTGNGGYSSFFPSAWTPQDVVDAIEEAYESREFVTGDTWRGKGRKVSILMYIDEENHIISAFPEYEGR